MGLSLTGLYSHIDSELISLTKIQDPQRNAQSLEFKNLRFTILSLKSS